MEQHFKVVAVLQIVMGLLSISVGLMILGIVAGAGAFASAMSGNLWRSSSPAQSACSSARSC